MKCLYNISQSSESIHLSNIRTLEGLLPFHNYEYTGYMPWVGAGGQNIEYPHTLVILSSYLCVLQMHFIVLLVMRSSGELRCSATALIIIYILTPFVTDGF